MSKQEKLVQTATSLNEFISNNHDNFYQCVFDELKLLRYLANETPPFYSAPSVEVVEAIEKRISRIERPSDRRPILEALHKALNNCAPDDWFYGFEGDDWHIYGFFEVSHENDL